MRVTRDVILDLLPIYSAGEGSADTRTLVESYLATDPSLARSVMAGVPDDLLRAAAAAPADTAARAALERTRSLQRQQAWWMAVGIFFTLLPASGGVTSWGTWFMWRDAQSVALASLVVAAIGWFGWFRVRRHLSVAGL